MFGALHIEMAAIKSVGTLLQDSCWAGALVQSGIASSGTAASFVQPLASLKVTADASDNGLQSVQAYMKAANNDFVSDIAENCDEKLIFEGWCASRQREGHTLSSEI